MATDKHVRQVCHNRFGEVIACTVQRYNSDEEQQLNERGAASIYAACPELLEKYRNRSWAVVTFVAAADFDHAAKSAKGTWQGQWDAESWETVRTWNATDMLGDIGSLSGSAVGRQGRQRRAQAV